MYSDEEQVKGVDLTGFRDRAQERRMRQDDLPTIPDIVTIDGEQIQLRGIDTQQLLPKINKKDIISKIKMDLKSLKPKQIKKTTHPMALKIEALLDGQVPVIKSTNTWENIFLYDLDPNFSKPLPTFFSKSKPLETQRQEEDKEHCIISDEAMEALEQCMKETNNLTRIRFQMGIHNQPIEREIFDDYMSEDIFKDAQEIQKPQPMIFESEKSIQDEDEDQDENEESFDPEEFIEEPLDLNYYKKLEEQVKIEDEFLKKKREKQKKMLESLDDHYVECYQPIGLTLDEEKERKEFIDRQKQVNPEFKDLDFIKKDRLKKKKKRVNLNAQLDQIEDIIIKKTH
ncbi:hypothetical protein pb186bvf_013216 [Paramecium bursaria]